MKISYEWLQSFFDASLPQAAELAVKIEDHLFEIEGIEGNGTDTVLEVNVTPNRAHDCLSLRGIAKEVSAILDIPLKEDFLKKSVSLLPQSEDIEISIDDPGLCSRYAVAHIKGVEVGPSPEWLVKRLASLGQHSINNVVDITNYVMFELGQPLHAFDARRLAYKDEMYHIAVVASKNKEKVRTLDEVTYELPGGAALIVDRNERDAFLGIAGIKGGDSSKITEETKDIILESATFSRTSIRKVSKALYLRTDASVRFENEISSELPSFALVRAVELLEELAKGKLSGFVDVYPKKQEARKVAVSLTKINRLLGTNLSIKDAGESLRKLDVSFETSGEMIEVSVPFERLDISIPEDLIEEIGRIWGYAKIAPVVPTPLPLGEYNKRFFYSEQIRSALLRLGFSEVQTSSFRDKGEEELANALASDKGFLRNSLTDSLSEVLVMNMTNAPLLGTDDIRVFEIGTVFEKEKERVSLALGVLSSKNKKITEVANEAYEKAKQEVSGILGSVSWKEEGTLAEMREDLGEMVSALATPKGYAPFKKAPDVAYKRFSPFPFILRDIALFVPESVSDEEVGGIIQESAGPLLIRKPRLFDTFNKDGKMSYAFRLVFQSFEKTLSDDEVNVVMEKVTAALSREGWEVR